MNSVHIYLYCLSPRQSKSPLWAHLMAYAESEGKEEFQSRQAVAVTTGSTNTSPDRVRRPHFTSSLSSIAMSSTASTTCKLLVHFTCEHVHPYRHLFTACLLVTFKCSDSDFCLLLCLSSCYLYIYIELWN